jgi:hypothetical protein
MNEYPRITDDMLMPFQVVMRHLKADPKYLEHSDCPYSSKIKQFLTKRAVDLAEIEEKSSIFDGNDSKFDVIEAESAALYQKLKTFGANLNETDVSEQGQYFRVATSLLEKIVSINERAANLRNTQQFQSAILTVIEDTLDPTQRTAVMDRLRTLINR